MGVAITFLTNDDDEVMCVAYISVYFVSCANIAFSLSVIP